MINMYKKA